MKNKIEKIIKKYLEIYPEEQTRQEHLINYINSHTYSECIDWNNFDGHIVCSGFVYSKKDKKFLVLYHKDLKMYLYPGGHMEESDINTLSAAIREVSEETGLTNLREFIIDNDPLIPIDIDTHVIGYNERLNLPEHYHYDFRYLFLVDNTSKIDLDLNELRDYKWIDIDELTNNQNYGKVINKLKNILKKEGEK